jgi:hypothetical protein
MRGRSPGAFARRLPGCMFGRCTLRLRQCIPFASKRGVLSRRSAAGSGSLVARHRQVHAPCEAETGNGHKRRSAKQADRHGVLGYKGARLKRLAHRNASRGRRECEPPNMSHIDRERARCSRRSMLPESAPIRRQLNGADCSVFEESGVGSEAEGF